ncbi:MAG: hypothetical protein V3T72_14505 [Thermoanaerobaculia bacterium]
MSDGLGRHRWRIGDEQGRPRTFDPAAFKTKKMGSLRDAKRGWGHTIMLERALLIAFDQTPARRGMIIVVGPDDLPSP